jgi:hypothetical protein
MHAKSLRSTECRDIGARFSANRAAVHNVVKTNAAIKMVSACRVVFQVEPAGSALGTKALALTAVFRNGRREAELGSGSQPGNFSFLARLKVRA